MTADEREELIITLAQYCTPIIFNYTTFADGSLGLLVAYGDGEDQWMTLHSLQEWQTLSGAGLRLYEECHRHAERSVGVFRDC
jgi:hypothetical protein